MPCPPLGDFPNSGFEPRSPTLQVESLQTEPPGKPAGVVRSKRKSEVGVDTYTQAAAAAKSLQSCPTLCDPTDGSPPGSAIPGILQARTRVGRHCLLYCAKVKSEVAQSCLTLSDPTDCTLPGSCVHGILQARVLEWVVAIAFSECYSATAAAAAAKSLQSCPTLCDPTDGSPPGYAVPGILQARTRVGCHFLLQCMKVKSESEVAQSCLTLSDPVDCSLPGSSIHGIFQARVLEWGASAFYPTTPVLVSVFVIDRQLEEP